MCLFSKIRAIKIILRDSRITGTSCLHRKLPFVGSHFSDFTMNRFFSDYEDDKSLLSLRSFKGTHARDFRSTFLNFFCVFQSLFYGHKT
jgi:hypothetical protein